MGSAAPSSRASDRGIDAGALVTPIPTRYPDTTYYGFRVTGGYPRRSWACSGNSAAPAATPVPAHLGMAYEVLSRVHRDLDWAYNMPWALLDDVIILIFAPHSHPAREPCWWHCCASRARWAAHLES